MEPGSPSYVSVAYGALTAFCLTPSFLFQTLTDIVGTLARRICPLARCLHPLHARRHEHRTPRTPHRSFRLPFCLLPLPVAQTRLPAHLARLRQAPLHLAVYQLPPQQVLLEHRHQAQEGQGCGRVLDAQAGRR